MKNKTCAAYVCAFLLLVIVAGVYVLSGRNEDNTTVDVPQAPIEQTVVEVPKKESNGVDFAMLPVRAETEAAVKNNSDEFTKKASAVEAIKEAANVAADEAENEKKSEEKEPEIITELEETQEKKATLRNAADIEIQQQLVDEVYKTALISDEGGSIQIAYSQPEIPPQYHLTVKADVYDKNGATYCRYVSDGGWLNESSNYDSSEKSVLETIGTGDLTDKMFILVVKVGDANLMEGATVWQLTQNYDGTRELIKTYVN